MKNKIEKVFKGEVYKYRVSKRETEGTEIAIYEKFVLMFDIDEYWQELINNK